jgi:membrane fusion protein, heavy metal efflux system
MTTQPDNENSAPVPSPKENSTRVQARWMVAACFVLLVVSAGYLVWNQGITGPASASESEGAPISLDHKETGLVHLQPSTASSMNIRTVLAKSPSSGQSLRLRGQLMLDPSRLVHVHTRFGGEVISVAEVKVNNAPRQLRVGDQVKSGELLAVLWSKEIGEKKSDLVDAWSQLYLHETTLLNLKKLEGDAIAQRTINEMQRNYEADLIEVNRLRRTLRSWRIEQRELDEVESEARRLHKLAQTPNEKEAKVAVNELEEHWAEIEIKAPRDGVILEKNFTVGDIVDTSFDLFKIADLSRLGVMANAYEEDMPRLDSLPESQREWRIELHSLPDHPPLEGHFESIGNLIDPNQHTAVVTGWIDNPEELLRVGQFVEALIDLPVDQEVVELPVASVLDSGQKTYVFLARDETGTNIEKREIKIVRRTSDLVWIAAGSAKHASGQRILTTPSPIQAGQRVVVGGIVEVNSALADLQPGEPIAAP